MLKVIAACGAGMGSSQIIKIKLQRIFKKLDINAQVTHTSIGEAKSLAKSYDVVVCSANFAKDFTNVPETTHIIGVTNLLDEKEMEKRLLEIFPAKG